MLVPCLGGGEVGRERTGKVQDADTPPREQFSLSHVILAEEQNIKYHIWKKVLFYIIMMACGAYKDSAPDSLWAPGVRCSIPNPLHRRGTLAFLSGSRPLLPRAPTAWNAFQAFLYLHVLTRTLPF